MHRTRDLLLLMLMLLLPDLLLLLLLLLRLTPGQRHAAQHVARAVPHAHECQRQDADTKACIASFDSKTMSYAVICSLLAGVLKTSTQYIWHTECLPWQGAMQMGRKIERVVMKSQCVWCCFGYDICVVIKSC
jgi:hypothetical protein